MNLLLGVVVSVISGAIQSLGLTLQRKSHLLDQESQVSGRHTASRDLWRVGMVLFIVANVVGSSVQMLALPLVVLCPLQASGLVFNSIYATMLLNEPFTRISAVGTALVCVGAGVVAGLGAISEPQRSLDELLAQLVDPILQLWILFMLVLAAVLYSRQHGVSDHRRGVYLGIISGILSSLSLLMAKSVVEMLVLSTHAPSILLQASFWVVTLAFVAFAVTQLATANMGLMYIPTSILYPLTFCVFNFASMCNALIYYHDTGVKWTKILWVLAGTCLLVSGVVCLSTRYQGYCPSEHTPLLEDESRYTSLESLSPDIMSPDSPVRASFYRKKKRTNKELSKEQTDLVRELTSLDASR